MHDVALFLKACTWCSQGFLGAEVSEGLCNLLQTLGKPAHFAEGPLLGRGDQGAAHSKQCES